MAVKGRFEGKPWIEWAEDIRCLLYTSRGAFGEDFTYVSHTVEAGKYQLTGLPCAHAEENDAETLSVRMQDEATGLTLEPVSYTHLKMISFDFL